MPSGLSQTCIFGAVSPQLTDTECTPVWRLYPTRTSNGQPKFSQLVDNSAVAYGAFYDVFCSFQLSDILSEQLYRQKGKSYVLFGG